MNDYERIAAVICYLDKNHAEQPSLAILAERAGLSSFHFHRLFSRWAGITPKDFLQCLTLAHSKALLAEGKDVLNVALYAGLSGPSRLHDLCVSLEAASPGEIKSGGAGWTIRAGFAESPFGMCLVGESARGICHLAFVESVSRKAGAAAIQRHWPRASLQWDDSAASQLVGPLFQRPDNSTSRPTLRAFVRGTGFQFRVWRALLEVPKGTLVSYGELAAAVGNRAAARAVGTAVGQNPLAYLIPCHRVIRDTGVLGDYHWGETRKKAIVAWESSIRVAESESTAVQG
jgi:AraC family transcriptional regulator of adaptative response/methylated-DNA-[protein]-cysteine methyltransferase